VAGRKAKKASYSKNENIKLECAKQTLDCRRPKKVLFSDESHFSLKGRTADFSGSGRVSSEVIPISMK